ncbi:sugar transporter [Pedobacter sp. HMWF019]|nr:sugar transporter [Pedobacter sp. HMWF019]
MFKTKIPVLFVLCSLLLTSCISNKRITYLQKDKRDLSLADDSLIHYSLPTYRLQFNDIVDIQMKTTIPEMNAVFGLSNPAESGVVNSQFSNSQGTGDIYYMTGYTIDQDGNVKLPFLGKLKIMGLTLDEAEQLVTKKLSVYFAKNAQDQLFVRVKLGGIRFSTVGEFKKPGKYVVLQDRMTIFEAIAYSGDMTLEAKRGRVILLRQYPEGTRIHVLDLNKRSIIKSPYYFIQPNDQLYAEPMRIREFGTGFSAASILQIVVTSLTAIALVINLTR